VKGRSPIRFPAEAAALAAGEHTPSRFGRLGQWLRENF